MGAQWKAKGKAQAADARGKLFGRLVKDIMVAARNGADPASKAHAEQRSAREVEPRLARDRDGHAEEARQANRDRDGVGRGLGRTRQARGPRGPRTRSARRTTRPRAATRPT